MHFSDLVLDGLCANLFICRRYMKFARVIRVEGKWQICIRDKVWHVHNRWTWTSILLITLLTGGVQFVWDVSHTQHTAQKSLSAQDFQHHWTYVRTICLQDGDCAFWDTLTTQYVYNNYCRITEALVAANDYVMIPGRDNKYDDLYNTGTLGLANSNVLLCLL